MKSLWERDPAKRPTAAERGKLNVCLRQCGRCLFGADPYVAWNEGGETLIAKALRQGTHFTCHEWRNSMCRGFYNKHGEQLWYVRFAQLKNAINWVKREPG